MHFLRGAWGSETPADPSPFLLDLLRVTITPVLSLACSGGAGLCSGMPICRAVDHSNAGRAVDLPTGTRDFHCVR